MVRKNLLRGFKKPKGITFEHSEVAANYGRFVAYPFERAAPLEVSGPSMCAI